MPDPQPPPKDICCDILCWILFIICIVVFIFFPSYHTAVPEFYVESISLSVHNSSSPNHLDAVCTVRLQIWRPKGENLNISYPSLSSSLFYQDNYLLAINTIPPFEGSSFIRVDVPFLMDSYIDEPPVVEGIRYWNSSGHGQVIFSAKVAGKVVYSNIRGKSGTIFVSCPDVLLNGPLKKCTVSCNGCAFFTF